ncbi:MAG: Hpt domain-containing protein [Chloroflexi bacterium]|nr:Hpt domain-containing protein [Chloroflexota bacterium]
MTHNRDSNGIERVIVHVDEKLAILIPGFLDNRHEDVKALNEALTAGDYETIHRLGHSMKGSGGGYGFRGVSEIGESLEIAGKENEDEAIRKCLAELEYYLEVVEVEYE